jgi:hypothetical protein
MKTRIILLIVLFSIGISTTSFAQNQGPTLTETIDWINTKFEIWGEDCHIQNKVSVDKLKIINYIKDNKIDNYIIIKGSDIKNITFKKNDSGYWYIPIKGKYRKFIYPKTDNSQYSEPKEDLTINNERCVTFLNKDVTDTEVAKFVKALKHWATLCGAKIIDDDLF